MPPKIRSTPILNGNTLVIRPQNALESSVDKAATLVEFKPPSNP